MEIYIASTDCKTAKDIIQNGIALERDFGMRILSIDSGLPTLWEHVQYVPGRPEIVDYTDAIHDGAPTFKMRTVTIETDQEEREHWYKKINAFARRVHGKKFHILRSDDPEHYLVGRFDLTAKRLNAAFSTYKITIKCNPYLYIIPGLQELSEAFSYTGSVWYDYYLGDYCEAITAVYTSASGGELRIVNERNEFQSIRIPAGEGSLSFTPKYHGNVRISFSGLERLVLDGLNMEV